MVDLGISIKEFFMYKILFLFVDVIILMFILCKFLLFGDKILFFCLEKWIFFSGVIVLLVL